MVWLPFTIVLGMLARHVYSAGMATHTMVGVRASKYYGKIVSSPNHAFYNEILSNYSDIVVSGSDFPDFLFLYNDSRHDRAEEAHWPPWQAAASRYVRSLPDFDPTLPASELSVGTAKLVAFLFGVSVHFAADEMWEGLTSQLGRGQGFTAMIGQFNLGDSGMGNDDEMVSNMASDFYMPFLVGKGGVKPFERYYPLEDVVNIYNLTGHQVKLGDLEESRVIFDLALWAENTFGALLVHAYSELYKKAPAVSERVIEMEAGLDDMAFWATGVWERIAAWLDKGPPSNPPPRRRRRQLQNDEGEMVDIRQANFVKSLRPFAPHSGVLRKIDRPLLTFADESDIFKGLAYTVEALALEEETLRAYFGVLRETVRSIFGDDDFEKWCRIATEKIANVAEVSNTMTAPPSSFSASPNVVSEGRSPVSYLGRAVVVGDFDSDGKLDVASGAPGDGVPGLAAQKGTVLVSYDDASKTDAWIDGPSKHGRFGRALEVLDINLDGVDDLVVSAPFASWNDDDVLVPYDSEITFRYWGRVYVYFGVRGIGLNVSAPSVVVETKDDFTLAGITLKSADCDGDGHLDLMIGSPFSSFKYDSGLSDEDSIHIGGVYAFLASSTRYDLRSPVFDLRGDADIKIEGPHGYDEFGYSMDTIAIDDATTLLFVGAPGHRVSKNNSNTTTNGAMYVYNVTKKLPQLMSVVEGSEAIAEFGASVSANVDIGIVAVSSPAAGSSYLSEHLRGGQIVMFDVNDLIRASVGSSTTYVSADFLSPVTTLSAGKGGLRLSRFGTTVRWLANNSLFAVGAPMWTKGSIPLLSKFREAGSLFVWNASALPKGIVEDVPASADFVVEGNRAHGRFGTSLASLGGHLLVVGSPLADRTDGTEMSGSVSKVSLYS
eukprot:g4356.t1